MATNTDRTLPSPRGPLPGNGSLVSVLRTALNREPDVVVGKPAPALFETAASLSGSRRPLAVGDRLDTDIEGAVGAGIDSLLVLTGVSGPAELLAAPPERRPTYVTADLSGLFGDASAARLPAGPDVLGGGRVPEGEAAGSERLGGGRVPEGEAAGSERLGESGWRIVDGKLDGSGEPVDALRLLTGIYWNGGKVEAGSDAARELLSHWGL
jgi:hypothetical protein